MSQKTIDTDDCICRLARPGDVPEMADLFLKTVADFYARNNISMAVPPRQVVINAYEHVRSSGIFHVAASNGRITGISGAVVRDNIWYLSAFWVDPGLQGRNIGMPLLRETLSAGEKAGANVFCTWSSIDLAAMVSYMKSGMIPAYEILQFGGTPKRIPALPSGYEATPLEKPAALELDHIVRGARREIDHDHWAGNPAVLRKQVLRKGKFVGYYYINHGMIGPVAWSDGNDAGAVMSFAFNEAAKTSPEIRIAVPSLNHFALNLALGSGLRLTTFSHFCTTSPFGRMEQYLPSGPSLY